MTVSDVGWIHVQRIGPGTQWSVTIEVCFTGFHPSQKHTFTGVGRDFDAALSRVAHDIGLFMAEWTREGK